MNGEQPSAAEPDPRAELAELAHRVRLEVGRSARRGHRRERAAAGAAAELTPAAPRPSRTRPASAAAAPKLAPPVAPAMAAAAAGAAPSSAPGDASALNRSLAQAAADLEALRAIVAGCRACGLCATRTQTVFMDGLCSSGILFIGEAPGEQEDLQGLPFVGRAGQLLTDIITKGMGLTRREVAIANVLKCRPPGNREPAPEEKALCTPFLERQIELLAPKIAIALGKHAASYLLGGESSMSQMRGRVHRRGELKVVVTYHPAYLLRTPSAKKDCWQDIQLAMREIGLAIPKREAGAGS